MDERIHSPTRLAKRIFNAFFPLAGGSRAVLSIRMKQVRFLPGIILVLGLLLLGGLLGWLVSRDIPGGGGRLAEGPAVVLQIQGLAEFATVKYVVEKIVMAEDVKPYGESRVVLVAHGVVRAGIDLKELREQDLEFNDRQVHLSLPAPRVLSAHLDENQTRVIDHSTGLLRRFDKGLEQQARRKGLDAVVRAAEEAGIRQEAEDRLVFELTRLLKLLGFEQVDVRFRPDTETESAGEPGEERGGAAPPD
ncbi:MAG: DUF4230 domain-containing protein [Verrucomicrobiales bacterium]|nr:DUF4230 domain-containing protein [Verrucomicrobiales bacterium]